MRIRKRLSILLVLVFTLAFTMPVAAKTKVKIKSISNIIMTINQGDSYTLPTKVVATYTNKTRKNISIKWNDTIADTSDVGTYTFMGTVKGYGKKVILKLTVKENKGSMVNPLSLRENQAFNLQNYSFDTPKKIQLQLAEMYVGDQANQLVAREDEFNDVPTADEEWVLMKFNLKYVSGSDELTASDIIKSDSFYATTGAKISPLSEAAFSGDRKGLDIYDVQLYPGAEGVFWYGILIKKSVGDYPLIRIGTGYDKAKYTTTYTWFSTDVK